MSKPTLASKLTDLVLFEARKATGAFLLALLTGVGTSALDGNLTSKEIVVSLAGAALAAAAVYKTENVATA